MMESAARQGETMDSSTIDEELLSNISEMFSEKIPFKKVLGLQFESITMECVEIVFEKRDELVGHHTRVTLQGNNPELLV